MCFGLSAGQTGRINAILVHFRTVTKTHLLVEVVSKRIQGCQASSFISVMMQEIENHVSSDLFFFMHQIDCNATEPTNQCFGGKQFHGEIVKTHNT